MTKSVKPMMIVLVVLVLLSLGAELALGWFAYTRLSGTTLQELRDHSSELRTDVSGLQTDISKLQTDVSGIREEVAALANAPDERDDPGQEDDVRIAGEYYVRSTLPISEAYHSGDRSALSDKQKETLDMAAAILDEIITPEMDEYEKELAVYTWMTHNLAHDEGLLPVIPRTNADCDNPYGVLKYHNAVCVGYATTFRMFMQMLDIPCMVVHNSERYHSWDLVQLGGGWYHTDIYSDAGQGDFSHFNMSDSMQGMNQSWNREFFPAADQYEYCYAYRVAVAESDLYHIPTALRAAIDRHESMLGLLFSDAAFGEAEAQIIQEMLDQVQNRIYSSTLSNELSLNWEWLSVNGGWLLCIHLEWYEQGGEEPEPVISEEAYEKIHTALEESFGDLEESDYYHEYEYEYDGGHAVG